MRLLILSPGTDIGGGGIALKRAFDRYPHGWSARAARRRDGAYGYPADIRWTPQTHGVVAAFFERADVVHVYEVPEVVTKFPGWQRKTIIVHHVGSRFRQDPAGVSARCQAVGAYEAVGSPELMRLAPPGLRGEMCTGAVSFETITPYRERYRPSDRIRIVHSPTNRTMKSTLPFLAACERLAKHYPIDVDLIEHRPWNECLERKAQADIVFDQVWYGYGANAIEAWAMGIPVVAGMRDPVAKAMTVAEWGSLPFVDATEGTIEQALELLVADPALREHWGRKGYAFGERVHSERVTVERMIGLYERAIARVAA